MYFLLKLYNLLLSACFYVLLPLIKPYLAKKNYLEALNATGKNSHRGILFHAASVGEINAIRPLLQKLLAQLTDKTISVTTTTITGKKQAQKISDKLQVFLSALDIKHLRYKQLDAIHPGLICIVETEIWPNLLLWAKEHNVPVIFISARMSAKSFARYAHLKFLIRYLEQPVSMILAQSAEDQKRFAKIFSKPVKYLGNIKLSLNLPEYNHLTLREQWGYSEGDFVLCWGSSRPGEESLILNLLPAISKAIPELKLIVALRHPNRIAEVEKLAGSFDYALYSQFEHTNAPQLMIIDTLGVLDQAYALSDLLIIGGSFFDFGGHNPLEAAFYAKPIIIGPYHSSCRESVQILASNNAIMVSDCHTLKEDILSLASDKAYREAMGKRAKKVLTDNAECVDKYYNEIMGIIGD